MSYGEDVYSNPGKHGLEIIAEINDEDASYSFNDIVVWKHVASGAFYYAQDSGCSCPSPFEEYQSVTDLTRFFSVHELEGMMDSESYVTRSLDSRIEFLRKVHDAMCEEERKAS